MNIITRIQSNHNLDVLENSSTPELYIVAIRIALMRLMKSELLVRVAQGIYVYPKMDNKLGLGVSTHQ